MSLDSRRSATFAGLLFILISAAAGPVCAQERDGRHLQVFLMTMGAGADISERFGHNAIWIRDTVARTDAIYNYGMFRYPVDFADGVAFGAKFAMGLPRYWLGVDSSVDRELALYRQAGRDVSVQELELAPAQRADLAGRLAVNADSANRYYAYDYYRDNCSTRVRDMLDAVLGGALRRATRDRPAQGTLRFHTRRSTTNDRLLYIAIDAALGPRVDRPIDQWEEMFLPEKVAARVRELRITGPNGRDVPLVKVEAPLLTLGRYRVEPKPPDWNLSLLAIGAIVAGLILVGAIDGPLGVAGRAIASAWLVISGLGGLLLLFFWVFTANVATFANHNLLFFSPLALAVVSSVWYSGRRPAPAWRLSTTRALGVSVILGAALVLVPIVTRQDNLGIGLVAGLPDLAAVWVMGRALRPEA